MTRTVALLAAAVLIGATAAGGCGFGAGKSEEGTAELSVTRDFGATEIASGTLEDPTESDTVVRFLDRETDIDTSYGGNFVDTIDGLEGSTVGGGDDDWFFFVNGYYSDIGAGESRLHAGDRIWWDYRYWQEAYRVPAVVGSFPEPFLHGRDGKRVGVVVECRTRDPAPCDEVTSALADAGVDAEREDPVAPEPHPDELRVLVGPWEALREDPAARQVESGPGTSGVYARAARCDHGFRFDVLDDHGTARTGLAPGGLVAAVRDGEDQPTWLVAGTDDASVGIAAGLVGEEALHDRYAVAAGEDGEPVPVPETGASSGSYEAVCG
jgi:hypothetical protein